MMAYQQHPAGMPHPGMTQGQHMGPGPPQNQIQPPGQALPAGMHPGVSGSGLPHVSQAGPMMSGMHSGMGGPGPGQGGPSQHALSHLAPQAQVFQQNPNMAAFLQTPQYSAQQQQQMIQRQRMLQQMGHQGGMVGIPNSGNAGNMTPAQFQAVQGQLRHPGVNLPAHMQHQLSQQQQQHQRQQQQQHAQHAQQQQQGGGPPHSMAQQISLQNAASQVVNPGQPGPMGQTPVMRQQTSMQGHEPQAGGPQVPQGQQQPPNQQPGPPEQQHQQPPQQQPPQAPQHQPPQPQQPQSQRRPPQQGPQPQQTPNPQQAQLPQNPQEQPENPQQQMSDAEKMQLLRQQQQAQQNHAQTQAGLQQQQLAMNQMRQQHMQNASSTGGLARLVQFSDQLSIYTASEQPNDLRRWQRFASEFFAEDAVIVYRTWESDTDQTKDFQITGPAIPRYYLTQFKGGVENIQIVIGGAQQKLLPTGSQYIECGRARFIYSCTNGVQLVCHGIIKVIINPENGKFELLELLTERHEQFLSRAYLEKLFSAGSPNQQKSSPKVSKLNKQGKPQRGQQSERTLVISDLPSEPFSTQGVTLPVFGFLEIVETMAQMRDLFDFSHANNHPRPGEAVHRVVETYNIIQAQQHQQQNVNMNMNMNMSMNMAPGFNPMLQNPGARTPTVNGFPPQFASPAHNNLSLPMGGSPHMGGHTPSPAQVHMQAPGLVAQHSQQGTSSSANASTNASPNATNKRRRASAVKTEGMEDGTGGLEINGVGISGPNKIKASPRVGGKRQKPSAA